MQFCVNFIALSKWNLLQNTKLSVFKSAFFRSSSMFMNLGNEYVLSQAQATEIGFLRRIHGVAVGDKVRGCEIRESLNDEPFFSESRDPSHVVSAT